jgi:hypothetical protein
MCGAASSHRGARFEKLLTEKLPLMPNLQPSDEIHKVVDQ